MKLRDYVEDFLIAFSMFLVAFAVLIPLTFIVYKVVYAILQWMLT